MKLTCLFCGRADWLTDSTASIYCPECGMTRWLELGETPKPKPPPYESPLFEGLPRIKCWHIGVAIAVTILSTGSLAGWLTYLIVKALYA